MAKKPLRALLTRALSNIKIRNLVLPVILVTIIIILGLLKNQFIVATVNGKPITRIELLKTLEKKEGKRILDSLITETLILQEGVKKGIKVTDQDIDKEFKTIERSISDQGQNLDQLLLSQNLTRDELKNQIKIQLILRKIVGEIKVTDKEVDDYLKQNKDSIPEDAKMEDIKKQAKGQLSQQKLNDKIQEIIQQLQSKAKIEYLLKL